MVTLKSDRDSFPSASPISSTKPRSTTASSAVHDTSPGFAVTLGARSLYAFTSEIYWSAAVVARLRPRC